MNTTIKPEHRANLETLAAGLLAHKEPPYLRMQEYAENDKEAFNATTSHPCGSNTCMVGFGPSLGILPNKLLVDKLAKGKTFAPIIWNAYSFESFGVQPDEYFEEDVPEDTEDNSWHFLFDEHWPNSIEQGVHRINMYLNGTVPDDWRFDDEYSIEDYS